MLRALRENAGWLGLFLTITVGISGLYVKAALANTDKRITSLEDHDKARERRERLILQKLDALCRATPNAQCPLGVE